MSNIMELIDDLVDWAVAKGDHETTVEARTAEAAALTRINELEADAARYRWLRGTTNWASNSSGERVDVRNNPELWDTAIDAAIARAALLPDNAKITGG